MTAFASILLPDHATKLRFKEPFVSEAQNLKDAGIIPPGVFRGFTPNPVPGFLLELNVDSAKSDSVAVVETVQNYNLTVRTNLQQVVDMTGQAVFPVFVVLRTKYQISPSPLTGLTTSEIRVVQTTLDNTDPQKLNDGDVKLCKVIGFVGTTPSITTVIPADRQDNGGPLLPRNQGIVGIAGSVLTSGNVAMPALAPVPGTIVNFVSGAGPAKFSFTCRWTDLIAASSFTNLEAGLKIDGVNYVMSGFGIQNGSGGDRTFVACLNGDIVLNLAAGPHTVEMIASSAGSNGQWRVVASPTTPATVSVIFTPP